MILAFLTLALVPITVAIGTKIIAHRNIHWSEFLGTIVIGLVVNLAALLYDRHDRLSDMSVVTGVVTSKERLRVSCEHSYQCRCRTVNKQRRCSTCWHHSHDYDWVVRSDVGQATISRADWQGLATPKRWAAAEIGEPFSRIRMFDNWIKAAPDSLFGSYLANSENTQYVSLPATPMVFDYYRYRPVSADGNFPVDGLNSSLVRALPKLTPKLRDVTVVITGRGPESGPAIEAQRLGGADNQVSIAIGVSAWPKIDWVHAYTYGRSRGNAGFNLELSNAIKDLGTLEDPDRFASTIVGLTDAKFKATPVQDFAYLASEIRPRPWAIVLTILLNLVITLALSYKFANNSLDKDSSL